MTPLKELVNNFGQGDKRSLGRLISWLENGDTRLYPLLAKCYEKGSRASVIGVTGPPGSGKSTLINRWIHCLRRKSQKVAVIAIDPVSPFGGGAILGDRIRWTEHFNDDAVFIRSLSTRGKLGGLSLATRETVLLLDAFGFDVIFVETVGVGQSEIDVYHLADVVLLVLVPEWGDGIQALKSGIIEIADVFAINKSERPGADTMAEELRSFLGFSGRKKSPVFLCQQADPESTESILDVLLQQYSIHSRLIQERRQKNSRTTQVELLESAVNIRLAHWLKRQSFTEENPYEFIQKFLSSDHYKTWLV